jgi:putative N-acetyltransferase (TIGR04045 family)
VLGQVCRAVRGAEELAVHHRIRRTVFVEEQGLFAGNDVDRYDTDPATIHVLGLLAGRPAGAVRLYPLGDALWRGDRLAVLRADRAARIGGPLVRYAVATAGALGGTRMLAQIQVPNVRFFTALGWRASGEVADYHGRPHQPMSIDLR